MLGTQSIWEFGVNSHTKRAKENRTRRALTWIASHSVKHRLLVAAREIFRLEQVTDVPHDACNRTELSVLQRSVICDLFSTVKSSEMAYVERESVPTGNSALP